MGEGGELEFFYGSNLFLLDIKDCTQIFNIVALLLFWLNLKFTPKYTIVGGKGRVVGFFKKFQTYSMGHS
jgi:hypothetical protein